MRTSEILLEAWGIRPVVNTDKEALEDVLRIHEPTKESHRAWELIHKEGFSLNGAILKAEEEEANKRKALTK